MKLLWMSPGKTLVCANIWEARWKSNLFYYIILWLYFLYLKWKLIQNYYVFVGQWYKVTILLQQLGAIQEWRHCAWGRGVNKMDDIWNMMLAESENRQSFKMINHYFSFISWKWLCLFPVFIFGLGMNKRVGGGHWIGRGANGSDISLTSYLNERILFSKTIVIPSIHLILPSWSIWSPDFDLFCN